MISDQDRQFFKNHRGKIFFTFFFIILGILFMTLGFLKTMFIFLLAVGGWIVGRVVDDRELIRRFLNNYLGK